MEHFIAHENIRRFEAQLKTPTGEAQGLQIRALLEAERRHLREIEAARALQSH